MGEGQKERTRLLCKRGARCPQATRGLGPVERDLEGVAGARCGEHLAHGATASACLLRVGIERRVGKGKVAGVVVEEPREDESLEGGEGEG